MRLISVVLAALWLTLGVASAHMTLTGAGPGAPGSGGGGSTPMSTPFMFTGITSSNPSTSSITYNMLMGGENVGTYNATIGNSQAITGVAGTFSRLYVNDTTLTAGGYSVCLTVNGSTCSTLTCDVTSAATSCTDTAHSVTVAPTDLLAWKWCPYNASGCTAGTAPTQAAGGVQIAALFTSTANQESPLLGGSQLGGSASGTAQNWGALGAFGPWAATSDTNVSTIIPPNGGGVIDQLEAWSAGALAAGATYDMTVYQNSAATAITCQITSASQFCNDATHPITVAPTDTISVLSCPANATGCPSGTAPSGTRIRFATRFKPTTANTAILTTAAQAVPATTVTRYGELQGAAQWLSTESGEYSLSPALASTMTIDNLIVAESTAPGAGNTRAMTLRGSSPAGTPLSAAATTSLTCTITNSSTLTIGGVASTPACEDTGNGHAYAANQGNYLDVQAVPTGTQAAVTWFKMSATVTVP
jgi:hypothetical protein